jgi:hypothetical protein
LTGNQKKKKKEKPVSDDRRKDKTDENTEIKMTKTDKRQDDINDNMNVMDLI